MIALDAGVLSLLIYAKSGVPNDFKTGAPIEHAKERVDALVRSLEDEAESIVIPAPALSEALVVVAPDCQKHVDQLESQSCFKIRAFATRAAIEVALRVKSNLETGDKKEGFRDWDKVKYDHQIVAIAKVEGVTTIYSMDKHIHQHGKLWGIPVLNVSDIPIPKTQGLLDLTFDTASTTTNVEAEAIQEVTPSKEVSNAAIVTLPIEDPTQN